jgi:caffeoyl-CoA O-methyltransferase
MEIEITPPEIERYIQNLYPLEDPVLKEMEALGNKQGFPIIGPLVGRLLYQYTRMISAKRIFEMGSGFGYSAFWFSLALPENGEIHLSDASKKNLDLARDFLVQGNLVHKAQFHSGDSSGILDEMEGQFDIILIDVDKEQYPIALEMAKPKVKVGGLLITDNLLWFGHVLEKEGTTTTESVKQYNRTLFNDCDFVSTLLPVRDGVGVSFRIR